MAPSGGKPVAKSSIGGYAMNDGIPIRLSRKQKNILKQIGESQPVSTFRLGFIGKKFEPMVLLEQNGLIARGKSSQLGRLWSLTDAGRSFL
jgi:hypothetical protein